MNLVEKIRDQIMREKEREVGGNKAKVTKCSEKYFSFSHYDNPFLDS